MRKFSLKFKFFILTLFLGIFFMLAVVLIVNFRLKNMLIDNELQQLKNEVSFHTQEINDQFKLYELMAYMLGTRTRVMEYLSDQSEARRVELDNIFREYNQNDSNILSIYLLNKEGKALISSDPSFVGNDYSFRDYFQSAIKGEPYFDALIGKTSNQFGFYFSYPVKNQSGEVIGVLALKISDGSISDKINNSIVRESGNLILADNQGVILFSSDPDFLLHSIWPLSEEEKNKLTASQRFLNREIQPLFYSDLETWFKDYEKPSSIEITRYSDSHEIVVYNTKIEESSFYLLASVDITFIERQIITRLFMSLLIGLLVVIAVAFLVYLVTIRIFINPLKVLIDFSQKISSGDFQEKITFSSRDEMNELAMSMNIMSEKLKNYYSDLSVEVTEKTEKLEKNSQDLVNQQKAILNILEDVEEEKNKVEGLVGDLEKFKLAVENASDHIVITDPEGIVVYGNKAIEKITGYKVEDSIGKKAGVLWKMPMPFVYYKKMWETIKVKKKNFIGEINNKRKNGEVYTAVISISPVLDKNKKILYFVGIERDITKEKEVDKAKTEFVSLASHQLRTPLTAINWYTEMLLDGDAGKLNKTQNEYLRAIYDGNQRMVELVNSLLNVSRMEMGTFIIEPELLDIRETADRAVNELKPQVMAKSLELTKKYDSNLTKMKLDEKLIHIVFQNLLSNAVKYTREKGKINLSIEKGKKDIEIKVSDNGYGIPKFQQTKIFSKMFRADNVRAMDTEGNGLGLYLVKSIVENAGGKIWFESVENEGTTFFVTIPNSGMKKKEGTKKLN